VTQINRKNRTHNHSAYFGAIIYEQTNALLFASANKVSLILHSHASI